MRIFAIILKHETSIDYQSEHGSNQPLPSCNTYHDSTWLGYRFKYLDGNQWTFIVDQRIRMKLRQNFAFLVWIVITFCLRWNALLFRIQSIKNTHTFSSFFRKLLLDNLLANLSHKVTCTYLFLFEELTYMQNACTMNLKLSSS